MNPKEASQPAVGHPVLKWQSRDSKQILSNSEVSVPSTDHNISSMNDNSIHYSREAIWGIHSSKVLKAELLDSLTWYIDEQKFIEL